MRIEQHAEGGVFRQPGEKLFLEIERGLKVYFVYALVLSLFRILFIAGMTEYMLPETGTGDVFTALWRGFRLSMQTAGGFALAVFAPAAVMALVSDTASKYVLRILHGIGLLILSVGFIGRFPYYRQFHSGYNQLLFNTANDDVWALFLSLVYEYNLPLRFAAACLLAYVLWRLSNAFIEWEMPLQSLSGTALWVCRGVTVVGIGFLVQLSVFGGSLGWQTAVDWENAGVTRDLLLNEAVLDDAQAVYRGYTMNHRLLACNGLDFTTDEVRRLAAKLANRPADTDDLDVYLTRTAKGGKIEKPKHIFVIIGESFANWPLLSKYKELHIADGTREIINGPDSAYCSSFLPNGGATISAVTGITTGFADANLYLTTMPEAFAEPYSTAPAPQFKELGYTTEFWYAGPASWERIGAFVKAQGYDRFYSEGDFGDVPRSVWGVDDEYLYAKILNTVKADEAGLHVILNVSNHSPYGIDVEGKGFDKEKTRQALPQNAREDEELLRELGHYWYADRELSKFIKEAKKKFPDSLFVIIGDHADRYNIQKTPPTYERFTVPFIMTGKGVRQYMLPEQAAGSQIDVMPTIIELIAPEGFTYHALGQSMMKNKYGVNYMLWVTENAIGKADTVPLVPESFDGRSTPASINEEALQDYINAIRSISWYRAKYGPILDETKLIGRE